MSEQHKIAWEGKWLRIRVHGTWEYCERTTADGLAVIIVAVTPQNKLLFVEQYRVPMQRNTIEMPAGLVGDTDASDSIEDAARRELLEETGWYAGKIDVLMTGPTSSGMSNEQVAFVRASELEKRHNGGGDDSENITVHEIDVNDAPAWLQKKINEGYGMDAKLWAGLWLIERNPDGSPVRAF